MPVYKITKETDITDGYTRYFLYIDNLLIKGSNSLHDIMECSEKIEKNNGTKIITETIKEYSC